MSRIEALDPAQAQGKTKELLDGVNAMLGATPNLFRVAARAPAALDALVGMFGATGQTSLRPRAREAIALIVAQTNGCDYCLSAHSVLGKGAGLSDADIELARDAAASDPKLAAMLRFSRTLVIERGKVSEEAVRELRGAGVSDAETLEIVAVVALNVLTNYLNLVAGTDIDFPVVRSSRSA